MTLLPMVLLFLRCTLLLISPRSILNRVRLNPV